MNNLPFASWFLQEQRMKKNDMESEEEKKMEDARWKANRIVTMATLNIQLVAMDSLAHVLYFLLKDDQIEEAHRKAAGFDGMLSKWDKI